MTKPNSGISTAGAGRPRREALSIAIGLVLLASSLAGCEKFGSWISGKPDIAFASYGDDYASKPDLAQVEYEHPIMLKELTKVTPKYLAGLKQEELDQLYARRDTWA